MSDAKPEAAKAENETPPPPATPAAAKPPAPAGKPAEIGGPKGPEPTRFGDWERQGRCVDF
ncbi:MAG: DUF1674 domain-containing protein [Alphaproteobacteria bacterium]